MPQSDQLENTISSSAAAVGKNDSLRKFIRTADIRFKVNDVAAATYDIENVVARHGGFISYTNLTSQVDDKTVVQVSADSTLQTTRYTVVNSITLRVQNSRLDTTLKDLSGYVQYLDHRVIKADDVSIQMLGNQMEKNRNRKFQTRTENAVDKNRKKLSETMAAENLLLEEQRSVDEAEISNLNLMDQVQFSTVNLFIYQNQGLKHEKMAIEKIVVPYQPGFGNQLKDAFNAGWNFVEYILIFIARLWAVILIGLGIYLIYKKYVGKPGWVHLKN